MKNEYINHKKTQHDTDFDADITVIGAGLLGCFAARALRRYNLRILVLEMKSDVCTGISKTGSGIIYPGYDMASGSLKQALTIKACAGFPALCESLGVPYSPCGSLMVGFGPKAEERIRHKYEKGTAAGIPGLRLLSGSECLELEPTLSQDVKIGLYASATCTVNPWDLGIAAYENARENGVDFLFRQTVCDIRRLESGFLIITDRNPEGFSSRVVINCAGLNADTVHEMTAPPSVRIRPTGADYYILPEDAAPVPAHVIFHEPEEKGKGLTAIPAADGNTLIGPTNRPDPEVDGCPTLPEALEELKALSRQVLPTVPTEPVLRSYGAVRPNPYGVEYLDGSWKKTDRRMSDFNILMCDGLISLIGIKTPGLTCADTLGNYICEKAIAFLKETKAPAEILSEKASFRETRKAPVRVKNLCMEDRDRLIRKDSSYGNIICTCREISEGEIRDAVRRGASTLDGVKRRTGILMGYCQGSRCIGEALKIMADELGCPVAEIEKE